LTTRRNLLAAGGTLAAGLIARKPLAAVALGDLASHLALTDPPVAIDSSGHRLGEFVG
jgi:hypothetical protein